MILVPVQFDYAIIWTSSSTTRCILVVIDGFYPGTYKNPGGEFICPNTVMHEAWKEDVLGLWTHWQECINDFRDR